MSGERVTSASDGEERTVRVCRRALLAAGGAAAALCATGCETTYDPGPAATRGGPAGPGATTPPTPSRSSPQPDPAAQPARVLGPTSAVPVGGGTVFRQLKVVVTQPAAGDYRAFSAVCTHARCLVSEVTDEGIYCPCHASVFSISNGAALRGPATQALAEVEVSEADGNLRLT